SERLAGLQQLLRAQQEAFLKSQNGVVVEVLFEGAGRRPGQILGRSPYMQTVHVEAPERLVGTLHNVRIKEILTNSLTGDVEIGGARGARDLPAEGVCA
ncbi:MAG: TRAM domain-containing protein, partial [Proteobacteria bacterium]|nr:TRAM domain-containing protein [Pseudomonadota bacterium]